MTLAEIFKTNCRATASILKEKPSLAFSDLISGIGGKNKNGTIARLTFDSFFIDLYFIESGPLAYAPNTIWISVGFESCSFLPFSVYDILAVAEPKNFKCYTYPYLYTQDIMLQAFGEINELLKALVPELVEIEGTGTLKNNLILSQKETINKFVNDDIFKREIEMLDASLRIRDMLIRNFVESVISHVILGGVSDFFNNEHEKALKKLEKAKYLTFYETRLIEKLRSGELEGFDASPFRDEKYKNYTRAAKKHTYSLGAGSFLKSSLTFLFTAFLLTPFMFILHIIFSFFKFHDFTLYFESNLYSLFLSALSAAALAEIICYNLLPKIKLHLKNKRNKNQLEVLPKAPKAIKYMTIFFETLAIIFLFSAINNTIAFTESKAYIPENEYISLRQTTISYEHIETAYKAKGFYLYGTKYIELEHYILVAKNGDIIDLAYYPDSNNKFEKTILPILLEKGCQVKNIDTERDIK